MRDLGPVVWLAKQRAYAVPRYAECKTVLRDDKTFLSGHGVALNPITNRMSRGTTLNSDGVEHEQRRKRVAHRMLPRVLRAISGTVDDTARSVVDTTLAKGDTTVSATSRPSYRWPSCPISSAGRAINVIT
ncbi:hypothetical protein A5784_16985 [Mycobacterium sp. 852013-50091_SCH5140682]|uniref:hypothetical protein n=1 Tax=Mycobacterium sp. 852013-50091_SCH5140682 TaxID=1834109 RepID=UPI0007E963DD|nr:hypothetical protein [Mycobacterium sp. 852013-50091_SCH5140682]OBC01801.1 hypothetical protein A5784_16985 [Mycobacterium sp. 852013-50091_SCH5140682]